MTASKSLQMPAPANDVYSNSPVYASDMVSGPSSTTATSLALVLHQLAATTAKYRALSAIEAPCISGSSASGDHRDGGEMDLPVVICRMIPFGHTPRKQSREDSSIVRLQPSRFMRLKRQFAVPLRLSWSMEQGGLSCELQEKGVASEIDRYRRMASDHLDDPVIGGKFDVGASAVFYGCVRSVDTRTSSALEEACGLEATLSWHAQ